MYPSPSGMPAAAPIPVPHVTAHHSSSPLSTLSRATSARGFGDEESRLGEHEHHYLSPSLAGSPQAHPGPIRSAIHRFRGQPGLVRRPTGVRVVSANGSPYASYTSARPSPTKPADQATGGDEAASGRQRGGEVGERTPLIKPGVTPDVRSATGTYGLGGGVRKEVGLGRMVELGLPLIM